MTRSVVARPAEIVDAIPFAEHEQQTRSTRWTFDKRED